MNYNFDVLPDRRNTESLKWHRYSEDVLPLWVADTDFLSAQPVIDALQKRVAHGVFGYPGKMPELVQVIVERLSNCYGWQVTPDDIVLLPGVVTGFNLMAHAFCGPNKGLLIQTPVYPPFFGAAKSSRSIHQEMELTQNPDGTYQIDWDRMEEAITPQTSMFLLCNPHNPVGRVFRKDELEKIAEICLRKGVVICSDEIHCDLIYSGYQHIPIASLSPEIAQQSVTLMAPSKTYNIAGLGCSFAVIQNKEFRERVQIASQGLVGHVNLMGLVAALAAYRDGQEWLEQNLAYLEANRDFLAAEIHNRFPGIKMAVPEGTYLAWLDCREAGLGNKPAKFFEEIAKVGLNEGSTFGKGGDGFVRLNFGCPRSVLIEALDRMEAVLAKA